MSHTDHARPAKDPQVWELRRLQAQRWKYAGPLQDRRTHRAKDRGAQRRRAIAEQS